MKRSPSPLKQILLSTLTVLLLVISAVSAYSLSLPAEDKTTPSVRASEQTDAVSDTADGSREVSAAAGRRGVQNLLLCGKDRASGLTDVIVVARLDSVSHTVSLVQIPRDTYAVYSDGSYRKLNGAASALGGMEGLSDLLSEALGVPIDHYALVDLDCIGDVVDAVGGVTLTVPTDMDYEDASQGLSIHLRAGTQTLCGDEAEQFLRFRSGYATADLGRLDAQKLFLSAFLKSVKENCTLPALIRIVRTLYGRVETDLSLGECVRLAATGLKLSSDRLAAETLPGEAARENGDTGTSYYIVSRSDAYDTVNRMLNPFVDPLPPAAFDPKERFTSKNHPHLDRIYRSAADPA